MSDQTKIPLKPTNSHFTDSQWSAIFEKGHNLLVSASAGSGKTTVLVQRVIEKIKQGKDVDELLIVTYTEAAAKEMKQRIQAAVEQAITMESNLNEKRHLVRQLSLLPISAISTLHAFCLQVIQKYYYLIDLDPVFRLLTDETEILLLKEDVWEEIREQRYGKEKAEVYHLTDNFSNDRNDDGLTRAIFSLYEFSKANPDPSGWLDTLPEAYQMTDTLDENSLYQDILKPRILSECEQNITRSKEMLDLAQSDPELSKVLDLAEAEKRFFQNFQKFIQENQSDKAYQLLKTTESQRYPALKRSITDDIKMLNQKIKALRDQNTVVKKQWQAEVFSLSPLEQLQILKKSQPIIEELIRVEKLFSQAYTQKKKAKGLVDFNDLEHFTLAILRKKAAQGWQESEASIYYREKFSEVLVDEYQDINQLQESILFWLRKPDPENGNFFMVGDVKQSIYSFRLADPTLFIDKYNKYENKSEGERIILAENFRSRAEVLDFTNLIFRQIMDQKVGQLSYDENALLINGYKDFPKTAEHQTELLIFESGQEETQESESETENLEDSFTIDDRTEGELRMVAQKIQQLIQEKFPVYDKSAKATRPIRYSDIVMLTPTKKNNLLLLDLFKQLEIPLQIHDTQNYFQATEIRIMMALLQIIDNPYQDIPFASVLRSPIVGLSENEMAYIRIKDKKNSYYEAFSAYLADPAAGNEPELVPELKAKAQHFKQQLTTWRKIARREEIADLIWQIYQETGFLDYVGGLPSGKQRQANLHALYERAANYEEMSFKGLFQFIRFIKKMQEKDKDLAEPTTVSLEDTVRVMTIHASKGLEFPVVFVLDLTKKFNLSDLKTRYLFDEHLGAGIQFVDTATRLYYATLPMLAIKMIKKNKLLAEEMRKLYVALTRAEEKLFLVGSYESTAKAKEKWSQAAAEEELILSESLRTSSNDLMKWIGMALIRHPDSQAFETEQTVVKVAELQQDPAHFKVSFISLEDLKQGNIPRAIVSEASQNETEIFNKNEQDVLKAAEEILAFNYPYGLASQTASYQSVSEIKRVFEDPDEADLIKLELTKEGKLKKNRYVENSLRKPHFLERVAAPKAADIGTATHLILQRLPLDHEPNAAAIQDLIQDLVQIQAIAPTVAQKIDIDSILQFFESELGQKLIVNHENVFREQPFSMLLKAKEIFADYPKDAEDVILIHGMMDGFIATEKELILYDFKTDTVPEKQKSVFIEKIIAKYQGQIHLYQKALEQATSRKITETDLVLLGARTNIIL